MSEKICQEYFHCDCSHLAHSMRLSVWRDDDGSRVMYAEVMLAPNASLWARIRNAVWHVMGWTTPYYAFDEFRLREEDAPRLQRVLDGLRTGGRASDELH